MSDHNPRPSFAFKLFFVGLFAGYLLAAIGEGVPFSAGTCIGAFLGSIFGILIGLVRW